MMKLDRAVIKEWTVLVVDDEEDNREVAERLFRMFGATVKTANNGKEALDYLEDETPSVILLDLSMPVMDGWETLYKLRHLPGDRLTDVPVIAVTAHAMAGDETRVRNAGFDDYVSKPFNSKTLLKDVYVLVTSEDAPKAEADKQTPKSKKEKEPSTKQLAKKTRKLKPDIKKAANVSVEKES